MSNFIISYDSEHLLVLFHTSPKDFIQVKAELQQFFWATWFFLTRKFYEIQPIKIPFTVFPRFSTPHKTWNFDKRLCSSQRPSLG